MKSDLSDYSTEDLLSMSIDRKEHEKDFRYEADKCLFRRWRGGCDLEHLVQLLESSKIRDRLNGAYFLVEAHPRGDAIRDCVRKLVDDPLPRCRWAFVAYMTNSGLYGEKLAIGLAESVLDFALEVRLAVINWAVYTTDARFEHFARLVASGKGATNGEPWRGFQLRRSLRALDIARRLRRGESVKDVRTSTPEEDSYTFDYFQVFEKRLQRYGKWRKTRASEAADSESKANQDRDTDILGQEYDNLGKRKTPDKDLPASALSSLTDAELQYLFERANESLRQLEYEQRLIKQYA